MKYIVKYNEMSFSPEEVKEGLDLNLLKYLLDYNKVSKDTYNDIHITYDGYCTIIQWNTVFYDESFGGGKFEFVDEDEKVCLQKVFPDGHYEIFCDKKDYDERVKKWIKKNPEWTKDENDMWRRVFKEEEKNDW